MTTIKSKIIRVEANALALCAVKASTAGEMTHNECAALMSWCDCQTGALWDELSLQEILNVYRVSAEWVTWEAWAEDDRAAAVAGYNRAVAPSHRIKPE